MVGARVPGASRAMLVDKTGGGRLREMRQLAGSAVRESE